MSSGSDESPPAAVISAGLAELNDICVAAYELGAQYRRARRPFLRYRARELETECHDLFCLFELFDSGWEPYNDANR